MVEKAAWLCCDWTKDKMENYTERAFATNHHSRKHEGNGVRERKRETETEQEERNYTNLKLLWKLVCKWKFESKKWNGNKNGKIYTKANGERLEHSLKGERGRGLESSE